MLIMMLAVFTAFVSLVFAYFFFSRGLLYFTLLFRDKAYVPIGIGAWLGLIMFFNVWVLIWPNQKKILGIVAASDEEKNKARRVAFLASRTNTALSIPMLFFMVAAQSFNSLAVAGSGPVIVAVV